MKYIKQYQITELNVVPMMVILILNSGNLLVNPGTFASVRNMTSGAGPLDSVLQARFQKLLQPDAAFNQVWGMSETTCICTMFYYPERDSTGSSGRMLPNHDAKIVDDDGQDVTAFDVVGELCVRGPSIVPRYYGNAKATSDCWDADGYFHTGDMAYISEKNKGWYIVDRKKVSSSSKKLGIDESLIRTQELIKVRGFQVAPAELEGVLFDHPEIMDAAVIGIQRSKAESELPRAYVVKRAGSKLTEREVFNYTAERLARYKNLEGGIVFVDSIPKNASGKYLKNIMREWAKRELGAKI
jgi:acyl-CoA synthetase (AMP-forming)/AMP-acid ligase II